MPPKTTSTSLRSCATNNKPRDPSLTNGASGPRLSRRMGQAGRVDHCPSLQSIDRHGVPAIMDQAARERGWTVAFTSRHGGVSAAPYDTLNLAGRGGDRVEDVTENRRRAATAVGFAPAALALARQVHGAGVLEVVPGQAGILGEADVLVSKEPGPVLGILTADCAPVLMIGERGTAVAHAGWRGLVAGAIEAAVAAVAPVHAAWIGPCIHACCYTVGDEVIAAFRAVGLPVAASDRVDPEEASAFALARAGVEHVATAGVCTSCSADYFSYRRDGVTGRQGAFLAASEA
jgi:purine-nucleoside/S-methyl-5'-thioadenosine phosphorylase / adenosine deaminase